MHLRHLARLLAVGAAAATAVAVIGPPAHAASGSSSPALATGTQATVGAGETFGGWFAYQDYDVTEAAATVKIPAVNCSAGNSDIWFGLATDNGDINFDASQGFADIQIVCQSGTPTYHIQAFTTNGTNSHTTGNAGDLVALSISRDTAGITAVAHDLRNHQYMSSTGSYTESQPSVILGDGSFFGPMPQFAPVKFTNVSVNGQYLGDVAHNAWAYKFNNVNPATNDKIVTTGGCAFGKNSFKLTWVQAT
ncbi:MAG: hypothetical protein ACJ735_10275 [Actinomycetes bacterium]